jgi:hypothetical protein
MTNAPSLRSFHAVTTASALRSLPATKHTTAHTQHTMHPGPREVEQEVRRKLHSTFDAFATGEEQMDRAGIKEAFIYLCGFKPKKRDVVLLSRILLLLVLQFA